jgi:enterochelin esterase family protein
MNYKSLVAYVAAILIGSGFLAQSTPTSGTEDFRPASTNQQGKKYPRVNSERRVRASFTAPDAQKVQLDIGGKKYLAANMVWFA